MTGQPYFCKGLLCQPLTATYWQKCCIRCEQMSFFALYYDVKLLSQQQQKQGDLRGHNHIKTASARILKPVFNTSDRVPWRYFRKVQGGFDINELQYSSLKVITAWTCFSASVRQDVSDVKGIEQIQERAVKNCLICTLKDILIKITPRFLPVLLEANIITFRVSICSGTLFLRCLGPDTITVLSEFKSRKLEVIHTFLS